MHGPLSGSAGELPVDASWFTQVNRFAHATVWLHAPMRVFAEYGVLLFAGVLVLAWWIARRSAAPSRMAAALWVPVATLLAVGLNQPLVGTVHESRPYTSLPHVLVLVSRSGDYSFPSDHAVMAGAVAAGVFLVSRRLGALTLLLAMLMAFTRVYVGAHYPGDVLAGLAFGAVVTLAGFLLVRPLLVRLVTALGGTPLRTLVTAATRPRRTPLPR